MRKLLSSSYLFLLLLTSCSSSPATPLSTQPVIPSLIIATPPACTTIQSQPTPGPNTPSLFAPESAADHVRGASNPLVTITDYSDYQDVRSGEWAKVEEQLLKEHPDDVRQVS